MDYWVVWLWRRTKRVESMWMNVQALIKGFFVCFTPWRWIITQLDGSSSGYFILSPYGAVSLYFAQGKTNKSSFIISNIFFPGFSIPHTLMLLFSFSLLSTLHSIYCVIMHLLSVRSYFKGLRNASTLAS